MAINDVFGIFEKTLSLRAKRSELLASNLVNADTPGYKAKDIDFASVLEQMQAKDQNSLIATNKGHIQDNNIISDFDIKYRIPLQPSMDGNTVESNIENAQFADNAMRYMASIRFLDGKIKGILTALKGE